MPGINEIARIEVVHRRGPVSASWEEVEELSPERYTVISAGVLRNVKALIDNVSGPQLPDWQAVAAVIRKGIDEALSE